MLQTEMQQIKQQNTNRPVIMRFVIKMIVLVAIFFCIFRYGIGIHVNYGNRGYPSIRDGDLVIYSVWDRKEVVQGDMVLYQVDDQTNCARVISAGGERVDLTNQGVVIDGSVLVEEVVYETLPDSAEIVLPVEIGEDEVFLLNDYRVDARDSRTYGAISKDQILGRVIFIARWRGF